MSEIVYVPHINVSGTVLSRQNDGSYTGSAHRLESTVVEDLLNGTRGDWVHRAVKVPWDVRVGQEWLRMFPNAWEPA